MFDCVEDGEDVVLLLSCCQAARQCCQRILTREGDSQVSHCQLLRRSWKAFFALQLFRIGGLVSGLVGRPQSH